MEVVLIVYSIIIGLRWLALFVQWMEGREPDEVENTWDVFWLGVFWPKEFIKSAIKMFKV